MSSEKTFKSSENAPSLMVTVAPWDRVNAMVKFEFPNALPQNKRFYVMDWMPHDDLAATLEAAAAEIRRIRGEKS